MLSYLCRRLRVVLAVLWVASAVPGSIEAGASSFGVYPDSQGDLFPRVARTSVYVPARDGTRLAIDLYLPVPRKDSTRIPAIVTSTRYWRRAHLSKIAGSQPLSFEESFYARRGYAVIHLDVRGTGASFGSRPGPWGPKEVQDGFDLVEWIVAQPWSDGSVGAFGGSYSGTSAALLGAVGHSAVKVVIPTFNEFDVFTDIAYPGGVFNESFVREWSAANEVLDSNRTPRKMFGLAGSMAVKGVAPVDGPEGKALLKQAVREHANNVDVYGLARDARFRDRETKGRSSFDAFSLHRRSPEIGSAGAFVDSWGSWMDAGTAHAALTTFMTLEGPRRTVIGPWSHGASHHASPFLPAETRSVGGGVTQMIEQIRVFDHFLKGEASGFDPESHILYYTMGEEVWRTTPSWPPDGLASRRLSLQKGGRLGGTEVSDRGSVLYEVDFSASSGTTNRWATQMDGADVVYSDRREADEKLLTFTGDPLETSLEITGHPRAELRLSSSTTENALHLYLEAVAADGTVLYLTEGLLHTLHRQRSLAPAPYWVPSEDSSWRTFREADARPMEMGEEVDLVVDFLPTSVVVPKGYRLRLAISGADAGSFERVPATGESTLKIAVGSGELSSLDLPSRERADLDAGPPPLQLADYAGIYTLADGGELEVKADEGILVAVARDARTVGMLRPGSASFSNYDSRAEKLLEAVRQSDKPALRELVAEPARADEVVKRLMMLKKHLQARVVSTENIGGLPVTVVAIGPDRNLLLLWSATEGKLLLATPGSSLGQTRFLAESRTRFRTLDLRSYAEMRFQVAEDGSVQSLEISGKRAVRKR